MISSSILIIDPNSIQSQDFFSVEDVIPNYIISSSFSLENRVEIAVYDASNSLIYIDNNFYDWVLEDKNQIRLDPENNLLNLGFDSGENKVIYNFINDYFGRSEFFLKDISSDRTELKLGSNLSFTDIESQYKIIKDENSNENYFDEFYLDFNDNKYLVATNLLVYSGSLLVKLYDPLPSTFSFKDKCRLLNKTAESIGFDVIFSKVKEIDTNIKSLKGPNTSIQINDYSGATTDYENYYNILKTESSGSFNQLGSLLNNEEGIKVNPDFTDFSSFIHFSSARQRLLNFYEKISLIETSQNELNIIGSVPSNNDSGSPVSSSKFLLENNINSLIKNFDDYEYYMYYESGSFSWPKSNSSYPYILESTGSIPALSWIGSDNENNIYYGGRILSASLFDNQNQDNLEFIVPEYLAEDKNNHQYVLYINMVGQFFDDIWLYIKEATEKLNSDNRVDHGVAGDLIADVIQSLGFPIHTNNHSIQNLYSSFIGVTPSGSYLPDTGSEQINNYIAINSGSYPYKIDDINKEIYKRLYHNLSYLLKKKGTVQAIRELANIYGIPDTILRINEFGGKDRDGNDFDYSQNIFNYALTLRGKTNGNYYSVRIPYSVSPVNTITSPKTIAFRVKFPTYISNQDYNLNPNQILMYQGVTAMGESNSKAFALYTEYSGSLSTGSYSGSIDDPRVYYGNLILAISGSSGTYSTASIHLPIFNKEWWSIMVRKDEDSIKLFAKSKGLGGIAFEASSSINSTDTGSWDTALGVYRSRALLRFGNGGQIYGDGVIYPAFSGSIQEIRMYNAPLKESAFNSFVLNPLSIEGNEISGPGSSYNILRFRAPLGSTLSTSYNDLYSGSLDFGLLNGAFDLLSIHPSVTGSYPTQSYPAHILGTSPSRYLIPSTASYSISWSFMPNVEEVTLNQSISGIRNRLNENVRPFELNLPPGSQSLSRMISIQQDDIPVNSLHYNKINLLEVAFSPQNEIDSDITNQYGNFNLGDYISNSDRLSDNYPGLESLRQDYIKKYINDYNNFEYTRLVKYIDNSFFKLVKEFTPARTSLISGILFKSNILERNKFNAPPVETETIIGYTPSSSLDLQNVYLTCSIGNYNLTSGSQNTPIAAQSYQSIPIMRISGGTGGSFPNVFFRKDYSPYHTGLNGPITQSWDYINNTLLGQTDEIQSSEIEYYNGEFSGSNIQVSTQSLVNGGGTPYLKTSTYSLVYTVDMFSASTFPGINDFLKTKPLPGHINILTFLGKVMYIIVSKTDMNGLDQSDSLEDLDILRILYPDIGIVNYKIVLSSENNISYIFGIYLNSLYSGMASPFEVLLPIDYYPGDFSPYDYLLGQIDEYPLNNNIMVTDYSLNTLFPINQSQILDSTAIKSSVKDYYYRLNRHINPRYEGSKVQSLEYNSFSEGDISYGKSPNIMDLNTCIFEYNWAASTYPEIPNSIMFELGNIIGVNTKDNVSVLTPGDSYSAYNYTIDDTFYANRKINPKPIQYNTNATIADDISVVTSKIIKPNASRFYIPTDSDITTGASQTSARIIQLTELCSVKVGPSGSYVTGSKISGTDVSTQINNSFLIGGSRWFITVIGDDLNPPPNGFLPSNVQGSLIPYNKGYENIPDNVPYMALASQGVFEIAATSVDTIWLLGNLNYSSDMISFGKGTYGSGLGKKGMLIWEAKIPEENKNKYIILGGINIHNPEPIGKGAIILPNSNEDIIKNFNEITINYGINNKPPSSKNNNTTPSSNF